MKRGTARIYSNIECFQGRWKMECSPKKWCDGCSPMKNRGSSARNGQARKNDVVSRVSRTTERRSLCHGSLRHRGLRNIDSVFGGLRNLQPEIVVNTAAMHHVEKCEMEPEKSICRECSWPEETWRVVGNDLGFVLVHVSTDYVFDGCKREALMRRTTSPSL